MLLFAEIIEKLKDVLSDSSIKDRVFDKDVANILNIPQSTFATMKKRNSIPYQEILEFCAIRRISVNWLFFDQAVDMLKEETEKFFQIRYFANIGASAGSGAEVFGENFETIRLDKRFISDIALRGSTELEAIHVTGDSMEPTLQDNSIVFVDRTQITMNRYGIFIVSTPSGLFIKRISQKSEGVVELISDNKEYEPKILNKEHLIILGKVVGNIDYL